MKHIHIVIAEDSLILCEGLRTLFSRLKWVQTISFAASLDELKGLMRQRAWHFVIINPRFVQADYNQFQQLKNQYDRSKWIGIIYSHFSHNVLVKLDGEIDIFDSAESIAGKMAKWMEIDNTGNQVQTRDTLTDREVDVLKQLAEGKSNKEIGEELNISINTVITHRKNISQKTGIKSVSGLTIYAVVQNLISLDKF